MSEVTLYDGYGREILRGESLVTKRSLAFSEIIKEKMPTPKWTQWTVKKAVKEGLRSSVWIFRSFGLISGSAAGVPFRVVYGEDEEPLEKHPLNDVLSRPNNQLSRKDCFTLIYQWLLLTGIAYFYKGPPMAAIPGTFPLWPVSPDRIAPIRSKDIELMIEGYAAAEDKDKPRAVIKYKTEEIIAFRIMDPANPLDGISPLMAAARIIDTDNEMQNFNKAAMQNRGVVEGFIAFKLPLTQDQLDVQAEAWRERNTGTKQARTTAFLGNQAEYHRTSLTPAEADFGQSRKDNRDEILSAVGTPPQLVGAQEASTYDNFRVSEIIHWRNTIVPLIGIVSDALTFFFTVVDPILKEGEVIAPDFSNIQALQQNFKDKTQAAEKLFKMGVPVKTISAMLKLGIDEFEGWDLPFNGKDVKINPATGQATTVGEATGGEDVDGGGVKKAEGEDEERARPVLKKWETRAKDLEGEAAAREKIAEKRAKPMAKILRREQDLLSEVLKDSDDAADAVTRLFKEDDPFGTNEDWEKELGKAAREGGLHSGKNIVIESRSFEDDLAKEIDAALANEGVILVERSRIAQTTAQIIVTQVADGLENGLSIADIEKAIADTGAFSPERALRISRTITGTGSSLGQLSAATMSGAGKKRWVTSGFGVRDLHTEREGDEAPIDGVFKRIQSPNGVYPRYPLDPDIAAEDRINCRCSMDFS